MVVCEEGVCNAQNSISFWRDIRFRARVNWVSFGEVCVGMWATGSVGNVSSTGVLFKLEEGIYGLAMMFFVRYCFHLNLLGGMCICMQGGCGVKIFMKFDAPCVYAIFTRE